MLRPSIAMTGLVIALVTGSALAQTPAPPTDRDSWSNESAKPAIPVPPATAEQIRPGQPATAPPARRDDEFDPPPAGCQYRGNKLDLLV